MQIFKETGVIPGKKNVLRLDPRGYSELPYKPRVQSARLTCRELQVAFTRGAFISVCKSWYKMGLPVLYSHYRVRLRDETVDKHPIWLDSDRGRRLASHALCLTVTETRWTIPAEDQAKVVSGTNGKDSILDSKSIAPSYISGLPDPVPVHFSHPRSHHFDYAPHH
jgi:hypothetical protein